MTSLRKSAPLPSDQLEPVFRLLRRTARFWWVGVLAAVVVGGAAVAAILLYPRQYRSEASLQYREGMQWSGEEGGGGARRMSTRLREMALSRAQLATIVEELGLYPELVRKGRIAEAVEEMRASAGFRFDQSDVFSISFLGQTPEQAQRVTARLVEMLIAENKQLRSQQAEIARQFLDEEKQRKAQDLAAREAEQLRFLAKHPEFASEQTTGVGVTMRARQSRAQAAAPPAAGPAYREAPAATGQEGALAAAKNAAEARLTAALRELADRRSRLTEQHPDTRVAAANAAEAEQAYRRAADALAAAQGRSSHGARAPARAAAPGAPAPLPAAASERAVAVETEWARLTREVNEARERLQQLDNQQFRAAMTASMLTSGQTGQILVIDPPFLPARPVGVRTKVLVLLALAAALAIGLLVAGALGLLDDLIYDPSDVERLQIAPVLAEVTRRSLRPVPGPGRSSGGAAMAGNDLDRPTRLPRSRQLGTLAAARDLALPAGPERGGAIVVAPPAHRAAADAAWPTPRPPRAVAADAAARPPASGVLVHMADAAHDGGHRTRYFSFSSDFSDAGPTEPEVHRAAHAVRIHRVEAPGGVDEGIVMVTAPDSPAASSFRVLRHRLAEHRDAKVLLVTSPRSGEGKTLSAVNLALALGEGGRARVLLVEANVRTPAVARLLGFEPPVGLAEQLELHREEPSEPWHVVETFAPWLHVLAVAPARDKGAVLDGRALAVCIDELRHAGYDHIVVDTPAVLESADVNLIEESVDGIVVAMWARRSHARAFRDAAEQVGSGKVLGVVLLGS